MANFRIRRSARPQVGVFGSRLLGLLEICSGDDVHRRPMRVLEAVRAPIRDKLYQRWSRAQALRLNSAWACRYEVRLAKLPYALYALHWPKASDAQASLDLAWGLGSRKRPCGAYTLRMLRAYALRVWPRNTERMVDHGLQLEFT